MNKNLVLAVLVMLAGHAHAFREEDSPEDVPSSSAVAPDNKPARIRETEVHIAPEPERKVVENPPAPAAEKPVRDKEQSTIKEVKPPKDKVNKPVADAKTEKPGTSANKTEKTRSVDSKPAPAKEKKPASADQTVTAKPVVKAAAPLPVPISAPMATAAQAVITAKPASAEPSPEQRMLIANAEKIDNMNRELLTQNQSLQLNNEKLAQQVDLLQHDRSAEGMRNGALAVIAGLFIGWFLAGNNRRRDKW